MTAFRVKIFMLALLMGASLPASAQSGPKTLYERIGGYDVIAKITDALLPKLAADPTIRPVVVGLADTSKRRNRQLIVDQLCKEAGGPCLYIGRTMEASHQGLGITDEMWTNMMKRLAESMDELKIREPERGEMTAIIAKLRDGIVEKPKQEEK
jgi:hemoglobin